MEQAKADEKYEDWGVRVEEYDEGFMVIDGHQDISGPYKSRQQAQDAANDYSRK